ncbi:MAG: class I SAM-dependent RNA methyltransferase [Clostridia bacterium]|nr:class I SAM-dependent RNA methyltransferase [Clostridia bacterium]
MKICVTTASGVEAVTKREIFKVLGLADLSAINGRIVFDGGWREISLLSLKLRTANRVEIILGEFKAETFDELFEGITEIPFEEYIDKNGKIDVSAKSVLSKLFALSATQSIAKKAICQRLTKYYKIAEMPEDGDRFKIEVAINKDFVTLSLDTSGEGLHRRGYRGLVGEAPLKETLAAALIDLSVWNPSKPLADLFCGSGTIPIEAARIAANIPSGFDRDFDFLHWKCADKSIFDDIKENARGEINIGFEPFICGFDIDEKQLKLARRHAELAGVAKLIHFQRADVKDFSSKKAYGVIISNPPYGERLSSRKEIETLYRNYGKAFSALDNWSAYTITPVDDFERLFGRKADRKRKLYNGKIECFYYSMLGAKPPKPKMQL